MGRDARYVCRKSTVKTETAAASATLRTNVGNDGASSDDDDDDDEVASTHSAVKTDVQPAAAAATAAHGEQGSVSCRGGGWGGQVGG